MIQIIPPVNRNYWINQRALTFSENDLENPSRVAVSLVSGTVIMVYVPGVIDYDQSGEYRKWILKGYSTKLISNDFHYVYARLSREANDALIVFSVNDYNIDGSISGTSGASNDYWYIKIGELTSTDGTSNRSLTYDSGLLGTKKADMEADSKLEEMFELSKTSSPWMIIVKEMFYEFTVKNPVTLLSGFVLGDKQVSGIKRSIDDDNSVPIDDNSITTTKYLDDRIESLNKRFIRKDQDDETNYHLSMNNGAKVKKSFRIGDFVTGIRGAYSDEQGNMEAESLVLRSHLSVPEIRFNRMTYFEGYNLISPGGGFTISDVVDNGNGTYTIVPELEEGEPCGQYVDDILLGYWHDKNALGDFAGFRKVQYRVSSVDYNEKIFVVIPRTADTMAPVPNMILGQTGNFTNTERQTYIIIDTRDGNNCITYMDNANTWDPEVSQMKSWFGKKKGMVVAGIDLDNYSAVLQNIVSTGIHFNVDEITGEPVRIPIDKGEWSSGKYAYYDRVSYGGRLWLCVNSSGTTSMPSENNPDWLLQVDKGLSGVGIDSVVVQYGKSDSSSSEPTEWFDSVPEVEEGKYLWTRSITDFTDPSIDPVTTLSYVKQGEKGQAGTSVTVKTIQYQAGSSATTAPTGTWSNSVVSVPQGSYLWTKTTFSDNTDSYGVARQGSDGKDGDDGVGIKSVTITYGKSSSSSVEPTSWGSTIPSVNEGEYLWTKTVTDYTDDSVSDTVVKTYTRQGETGQAGTSVTVKTIQYQAGSSPTIAPTGTWSNSVVSVSQGSYLWTKTTFSDDSVSYGVARQGSDGKDGDDGVGINSVTVTYGKSSSSSVEPSSWSSTIPSVAEGEYLWTKTVTDYTDPSKVDTVVKTYTKQGERGEKGSSITATAIEYQAGDSPISAPSGTWSKTVVSVSPGYYLWTRVSFSDGTKSYSVARQGADGAAGAGITWKGSYASAPSGAKEGWAYYNTVDGCSYIYSNGKWEVLVRDGQSVVAVGEWSDSDVPYEVGDMVQFANATYIAKKKTSLPPIPIWELSSGVYARMDKGAYALKGTFDSIGNKDDWQFTFASGVDGVSYWIDIPVSAIHFTSTGTPSPSAFEATCKMSVGENVQECSTLYLVARKYRDGNWTAHVGASMSKSISVPATAGYTQFCVRAYRSSSEANSWSAAYLAEKGVSVVTDGSPGAEGPAGAFPYDCGKWTSGKSYVWNSTRRDKVIHPFSGVYYNFLVKNYGSTVTAAPTSAGGDNNWEAMQKYESIATDTLFAEGANVAGFTFSSGSMMSQLTTNGKSNLILNGNSGYLYCNNAEVFGVINASSGTFNNGTFNTAKIQTGTIGGFKITESALYSNKVLSDPTSNTDSFVYLTSNGITVDMLGRITASTSIGIKNFAIGDEEYLVSMSLEHNESLNSSQRFCGVRLDLKSEDVGLYVNGGSTHILSAGITKIHGVVLNKRTISTTGTSISLNDDIVTFNSSSDITVYFPSDAPVGKVLYLKNTTSKKVTLSGYIRKQSDYSYSSTTQSIGAYSYIAVKTDTAWTLFNCG